MAYPDGQCEYDHYMTIFNTMQTSQALAASSTPTAFKTWRESLCECVNPRARSAATVVSDLNAMTQARLQLLELELRPEPCNVRSWWTVTSPRLICAGTWTSSSDSCAASVCEVSLSPCSGPCRLSLFSRWDPRTNLRHPFSMHESSIANQNEAVLVSSVTGQYARSWCLQHKSPKSDKKSFIHSWMRFLAQMQSENSRLNSTSNHHRRL
jgi:hypothetical protein